MPDEPKEPKDWKVLGDVLGQAEIDAINLSEARQEFDRALERQIARLRRAR